MNNVHLIKNQSGQNTGKVIVEYEKDEAAESAISRFDNRAVENLVVRVKPFFEKGLNQSKRQDPDILAKRIYLMNVPYDSTIGEL